MQECGLVSPHSTAATGTVRMAKKKTKRSTRHARPPVATTLSRPILQALAEADALVANGDLPAARDLLQTLVRQRPRDLDLLTSLVNVCYDLDDMRGYQHAMERLLRVTPNEPDVWIGLA